MGMPFGQRRVEGDAGGLQDSERDGDDRRGPFESLLTGADKVPSYSVAQRK